MGYFLAVTAFRNVPPLLLSEAVKGYMATYGVLAEILSLGGDPDPRTDAQLYTPSTGWTVVLWPDYFNIHDFSLARTIGPARQFTVSTIHVYDSEYWEHLFLTGHKELHAYCSRPRFWQHDAPEAAQRAMAYDSSPARLSAALDVPESLIQPYLIDADTLPRTDTKAHPDDVFPLANFWVFTDFWRRIGIPYPQPPKGLDHLLRFHDDFSRKLPAA